MKSVDEYNQTAKFKIAVVDVESLEFLARNARYMSNDMYRNLVSNIQADGELSQIPFCVRTEDGKFKVLSGNHRCKAAVDAGLKEIPIMYTDEDFSEEKQIAVQLSHNAISGKDDMVLLKELYEEIADLELKFYSGLDDKTLKILEDINFRSLREELPSYKMLTFLFLETEIERIEEVIAQIVRDMPSNDVLAAKMESYQKMLDALSKTKVAWNVHNGATAIMLILDIFERHYADLKQGWLDSEGELIRKTSVPRTYVPLCCILDTDMIPHKLAKQFNDAVEKMINRGEISKGDKYQCFDVLLAAYDEKTEKKP